MKSSEPIHVQINTLKARDWPKARSMSLGTQPPRGGTDPHASFHWLRSHGQDPPVKSPALLLANVRQSTTPPLPHPPFPSSPHAPPRLVFPSERKGNIPLASSMGLRGLPRRRRFTSIRRRANSDQTRRADPLNGPKLRGEKKHDYLI